MANPFRAGDIVLDNERHALKVLVIDEANGIVHVRFYDGDFADAEAVLAARNANGLAWTIGHVPLEIAALDPATCVTVAHEEVRDDELEGYRFYVEGMKASAEAAKKAKSEGFFHRFWKAFGGNA